MIAIDIDASRLELAAHNAAIYGVADKIEFILGDYLQLVPKLKADIVFLSPPWGGPKYISQSKFDLHSMVIDGYELFSLTKKHITSNIAYFLPRNTDVNQLIELGGKSDGKVEVEQNYIAEKLKTITAYYGNLVDNYKENDTSSLPLSL